MKMHEISSLEEYALFIERFKHPKVLTNNFMLTTEVEKHIQSHNLQVVDNSDNGFLFVRKPICWRLYYYINDINSLSDFGSITLVSEILYRGSAIPQAETNFLTNCGFCPNLVREQYALALRDAKVESKINRGIIVRKALTVQEVAWACSLFNRLFDNYSGDYLPESDYELLFEKGDIWVAELEKELVGALHQTIEGKVAWVSHVAVGEKYRGKGIAMSLMHHFITKNDTQRFMLWVQQENIPAVNMYQQIGFRSTNKYTYSMIKQ